MQSEKGTCRIAIVGMGPRGLAALEALAERARQAGRVLTVDIFDPTPWPGAGPNFSPDESEHCLLNIPIRAVDIPPTSLPGATVTGFAEWLPSPVDPERFPARAELGDYLVARFGQAVALSEGHLRIERHRTVIDRACPAPEGWSLVAEEATFGPFDEVLLALGQPQTKPDPQLEEWTTHARAHGLDLKPAYPANALLQAAGAWRGETVAIRGLGLSTMDVLRLLTRGLGGRFEGGRYHPSGREPACIVPFSLTGHAAVPKPANAGLDARFDPLETETASFETALEAALADAPGPALDRICSVLAEVCARLLRENGTDAGLADAEAWLAIERDDPGAQETRSTVAALRASIAIAKGEAPPLPGYVIGQVWRKWQPSLRRLFVRADADPETASALIGFSEGLKRFSYGPPVAAAEDLLILIESGLVDPRAADDPAITLLPEGWRLSEGERSVLASAMIDGVLPSPSLEAISEPLVVALCEAGRISPVADGLGARVTEEGEAIAASGAVEQGLGVLGRLALGSVISVDSIHDCHGETTDRWADGVMARRAGPAS